MAATASVSVALIENAQFLDPDIGLDSCLQSAHLGRQLVEVPCPSPSRLVSRLR
jgi:hypothetical protein